MANINLLPWREELREERKQEFLVALGTTIAIAAVILFGVDRFVNNEINNQVELNDYLRTSIANLDQEIAEIRELQRQKSELVERMTIIQDLEVRRPVIVRLFDELVRTLPDGVFYNTVIRRGDVISINGVAESNNRITALLREFGDSDWFGETDLQEISTNDTGNIFQLTVSITTPDPEEVD